MYDLMSTSLHDMRGYDWFATNKNPMAPNSNQFKYVRQSDVGFGQLVYKQHIVLSLLMIMSMNHFPAASEAFRCRYTSGRTYLSPYGNTGYHFVAVGNILSARAALMCFLAAACGLRFLLEQPSGSFLEDLPRFQWLWGQLKVLFFFEKIYIYIYISLFKPVVECNHVLHIPVRQS